MKTSIDISDNLFKRVRLLAQQRKTSMRALVEEGLRLLFSQGEQRKRTNAKVLVFGGDGLTEEFMGRGFSWEALRSEAYKDHGA